VLILGEAGIGKTRLVEELLHWAARQNIDHAYARSYAAEGELAYAPVTTLLQASPLPSLDDVWLTEVARLLPQVLAERPDLPPPQPMTESWQRQRLFQALAHAVLGGGSRRDPLLLVLDDLQWCDRESLEWLHYLLRFDARAPLLVVGTCRPEELDANCPLTQTLPTLHRDLRLTEIELDSLDEANTAALASSVSGAILEAAESQRLYQETEGNPLFVVEATHGGLPHSTEQPAPGASPLTPRVQAVLTNRLAQLSAPTRQLAEVAATIGRGFSIALLKQAADTDEEGLARGLDELWQRRIVRERGLDAYDFGHDKLREAAYSALRPAQRRLLHHRAAQALESIHTSDLDPVSRQVAAHYRRAGRPAQAIPYYVRAGQVASRIYAQQEALTSFERGLALLQEGTWEESRRGWYHQMAYQCYEGQGDVLVQLGRPGEARLAYESALKMLDPRELIPQSRLHRQVGGISWHLGEYRMAMESLDRAEAALGPPPEMPEGGWTETQIAWWVEWCKLLRERFRLQYGAARLDELEETLAKAEDALTRCAMPLLRAAHLQGILLAAMRRDRYLASAETVAIGLDALAMFKALGDPGMIATAEWGMGWGLLLHGDLEGAEEHLQAGLALADRTRHLTNQAILLTWLSVLYRMRGEPEASRQYALHGIEAATGAHLLENEGLVRGNLAWVAWREGDLAEAEKQGRAALELWDKSAFVYAFHWTALLPLLAVAVKRQQIPEALDHAQALLHPQQQKLPDPLEASLEAAIQAGDDGQGDTARQRLKHAIQVAQETGYL
jgi:tetratricopeptide (TPR) repeat protein